MEKKLPVDSTLEISVPPGAEGERLDRLLVTFLPDRSRSFLKRLIEEGYLRTNGENNQTIIDPSYRVKPAQQFLLRVPPAANPLPRGQPIPLDIVFEDEDLIVIDKPASLVVHPAPGNPDGTLVNALIAHCGESLTGIGGVKRPGIVHRLDKDTCGLLVAAKTAPAHDSLTNQFTKRTVKRAYTALVWGLPAPADGNLIGNIGRNRRNRKKMAVLRTGGREALTRYFTKRIYGMSSISLIECRLATGRTHQIRVHLAHFGHPIIGDPLYGGGLTRARTSKISLDATSFIKNLKGQLLHAHLLEFRHPISGETCRFKSPLSDNFKNLIKILDGSGNSTSE